MVERPVPVAHRRDDRLGRVRRAVAASAVGSNGVLVGEVPVPLGLPVCAALAPLLPGGSLRGGVVVACEGQASVSLAAAVVSAASVAGSWTAVLGLPEVGLAALAEAGVVLERVVCVAGDGDVPWPEVLAAAVDGFEVLVVGPALAHVAPAVVRRVLARAAARGTVLVTVGAPVFGADLQLGAVSAEWYGLDAGHGVARGRRATVRVSGRRVPRPRDAVLWLPSATGGVEHCVPARAVPGPPADGAPCGVAAVVDDAVEWRSAG